MTKARDFDEAVGNGWRVHACGGGCRGKGSVCQQRNLGLIPLLLRTGGIGWGGSLKYFSRKLKQARPLLEVNYETTTRCKVVLVLVFPFARPNQSTAASSRLRVALFGRGCCPLCEQSILLEAAVKPRRARNLCTDCRAQRCLIGCGSRRAGASLLVRVGVSRSAARGAVCCGLI